MARLNDLNAERNKKFIIEILVDSETLVKRIDLTCWFAWRSLHDVSKPNESWKLSLPFKLYCRIVSWVTLKGIKFCGYLISRLENNYILRVFNFAIWWLQNISRVFNFPIKKRRFHWISIFLLQITVNIIIYVPETLILLLQVEVTSTNCFFCRNL